MSDETFGVASVVTAVVLALANQDIPDASAQAPPDLDGSKCERVDAALGSH